MSVLLYRCNSTNDLSYHVRGDVKIPTYKPHTNHKKPSVSSHTLAPTSICDLSHSLCWSPLTDLGHISSVTYVCQPLCFFCGQRKGILTSPLNGLFRSVFTVTVIITIILILLKPHKWMQACTGNFFIFNLAIGPFYHSCHSRSCVCGKHTRIVAASLYRGYIRKHHQKVNVKEITKSLPVF